MLRNYRARDPLPSPSSSHDLFPYIFLSLSLVMPSEGAAEGEAAWSCEIPNRAAMRSGIQMPNFAFNIIGDGKRYWFASFTQRKPA